MEENESADCSEEAASICKVDAVCVMGLGCCRRRDSDSVFSSKDGFRGVPSGAIWQRAKAKQSFDSVFQKAFVEGKVKIQKDDQTFILMPESKNISPLDIKGVDIDVTVTDIISCIHESRKF